MVFDERPSQGSYILPDHVAHADALVHYCRHFAGVEAEAATMTAIDRLGFRVRARSGEAVQGLRINFPREVRSAEAARAVLVEMVRAARGR